MDSRGYINAVRGTFVQLGGKELEGNVLRKLGKGWHVGFQGDLCSWSEAWSQGVRGQCVSCGHEGSGKEDKVSQVAETSHMNKEEEKGSEAQRQDSRE